MGRTLDYGQHFWTVNAAHYDALAFWARVPMVLLTLVLGGLIFWHTRDLFGARAALCVVALFSIEPTMLAHGRSGRTNEPSQRNYFAAYCGRTPVAVFGQSIYLYQSPDVSPAFAPPPPDAYRAVATAVSLVRDDALAPNDFMELPLTIRAPATPGAYALEIDLVQEGVAWFSTRDSMPLRLAVLVR